MKRIEIEVIKNQCLGYTVYRGTVKASELYPALWVDRFDDDLNKDGYQRPFNEERSKDAAEFSENSDAFWPECILNIRATEVNSGSDKKKPIVDWSFKPYSTKYPNYGVLTVDYDEKKVLQIGEEKISWERAFSEVDCQHRLGMMTKSDKMVTVCIFTELTKIEEAIIFRAINNNQKKMDTSLVDEILRRHGKGPLWEPEVHIASKLSEDPNSPFYKKVNKGGTNIEGRTFFVKERTLRDCIGLMLGKKTIMEAIATPNIPQNQRGKNYDAAYDFIKNFWRVTKQLWSEEWKEPNEWKQYKLITTPGLKGLSMVGNKVFEECRSRNDYSESTIKSFLMPAVGWVDWKSKDGDFKEATGNAGAVIVRNKLREKIVPETKLI